MVDNSSSSQLNDIYDNVTDDPTDSFKIEWDSSEKISDATKFNQSILFETENKIIQIDESKLFEASSMTMSISIHKKSKNIFRFFPHSRIKMNKMYKKIKPKVSSADLACIVPALIAGKDSHIIYQKSETSTVSYSCKFKENIKAYEFNSNSLVFEVQELGDRIKLKQVLQNKKFNLRTGEMVKRKTRYNIQKRDNSSKTKNKSKNGDLDSEVQVTNSSNELGDLLNPLSIKSAQELSKTQKESDKTKSEANAKLCTASTPLIIFDDDETLSKNTGVKNDQKIESATTEIFNKIVNNESDINVKNTIHKESPINLKENEYSKTTFKTASCDHSGPPFDLCTFGFDTSNPLIDSTVVNDSSVNESSAKETCEPLFRLAENDCGFSSSYMRNVLPNDSLSENSFKCSTSGYYKSVDFKEDNSLQVNEGSYTVDSQRYIEPPCNLDSKAIRKKYKVDLKRKKTIKLKLRNGNQQKEVFVIKIMVPKTKKPNRKSDDRTCENSRIEDESYIELISNNTNLMPPDIKTPDNTQCELCENNEEKSLEETNEETLKDSENDINNDKSEADIKSELKNESNTAQGEVVVEETGSIKEKIEFYENLSKN